ncbi:AAA family ATPase [Deinococcus hopiensis]|uniref:CobQ/CobB/MinD/ParA nucleotide binding domain-containing protein n=1 Tax=Deinococcus hopiensis KR-140 TaxID=695939 RepID=A0A1W1ULX5_9DEIO|nr:AAA family ATPase [Deinococcus hopiensis]SMB82060.1 CobQ/CobB/MinD/ParA nucleotide binding domain-containing protein [Deinococcus hopiensis KR-140]
MAGTKKDLTFSNHAGGVGKSSSVRDIGYTLRRPGYRVILTDAEPRVNFTDWLGVRSIS